MFANKKKVKMGKGTKAIEIPKTSTTKNLVSQIHNSENTIVMNSF